MRDTPIEIYVACPYTSSNPDVRQRRFNAATRYAASLMRQGLIVFSPLTHGRPFERYDLPLDWFFWRPISLAFLSACTELHVLKVPGWRESGGVATEIAFMSAKRRPITYISAHQWFQPRP